MTHLIAIDPVDFSREELCSQLNQISDSQVFQFENLKDASEYLLDFPQAESIFLVSPTEDIKSLSDFLQNVRETKPQNCVILLSEIMTLEQLREYVSTGVDQILLKPFSQDELENKIMKTQAQKQQILAHLPKSRSGSDFQIFQSEISKIILKVDLMGWLTQDGRLPTIKPAASKSTIFVNCEHMKGINSIGVRSWIHWQQQLALDGFIHIEYDNLHPALLHQASTVHGFLSQRGSVNSFYLYYWCEDLGLEKEYRIQRGKHYTEDLMSIPQAQIEVVDGKKVIYELDHSIVKILSFYKGNISLV